MHKPSPAMVVALLGLFVALGGAGMAATGGTFILGKSNTADATSYLSAPVSGKAALDLANLNTATGSTALRLHVASGHAPLYVNSNRRVPSLNSDLLDGLDSTDFLPATASAGFVKGPGAVYQNAVDLPVGSGWSNLILDTSNPKIGLQYYCPSDLASNGTVAVLNRTYLETSETVNLFADTGSADPGYTSLASGNAHTEVAAPNGDHLTFQVQASGPKVLTFEVYSVHRPGRVSAHCHVQVQAILTG